MDTSYTEVDEEELNFPKSPYKWSGFELNDELKNGSTAASFTVEVSETNSLEYDTFVREFTEDFDFIPNTSSELNIEESLPKPLPLIQGKGAIEFKKELETLQYSDEIKNFYKGSRELVKKLKIFK